MMDFETDKGGCGLETISNRLQHVGITNGWVLETEFSYHYYGHELISDEGWIHFMGKCLLLSIFHDRKNIEQVADPRYIGHSLMRGGNVLRITTRGDKSFVPTVVATL